MKISIYNQPQEILVQTISVKRDQQNPDNTFLFHCPYCSYQIIQIQGLVTKIAPGLAPTEEVVVINKCARCGLRYTTQSKQPDSFYTTTVVLTRYKNEEPSFRCYICRTPIFNFDYSTLFDLVARRFVEYPFDRICPNEKCSAHYFIADVI